MALTTALKESNKVIWQY